MGRVMWLVAALVGALASASMASAQPAMESYRAWLGGEASKVLKATVVRNTDVREAERVAALLRERGITPTIIKRSDLPGADLDSADILIILRDTQEGPWKALWGTEEEAGALQKSKPPVLGIGLGGLCAFGRMGLPINGGKTVSTNSQGVTVTQARHALVNLPNHIEAGADGQVKLFTLQVVSLPAYRGSFTGVVIPLAGDPGSRDHVNLLFQEPRGMYWGFDGPFSTLTAAGKDLFENSVRWTVWAAAQNDGALRREGTVARADPMRQGDRTVELLVTRADGAPAALQSFVVQVRDAVGAKGWAEFAKVRTDANGRATIGGLTGGPEAERYQVMVSGTLTPALAFSLTDDAAHRTLTARIPPRIGEQAPDLELRDVLTDGTVKLSSLRGKVVLIDFWATWCVPCQEPMRHNHEMAGEHAADWSERVAIVGVSIDSEMETVKKHVTTREWTNLVQLWVPTERGKARANPEAIYGFQGIPTVFLIDQEGRVRWRGHPAAVDIEKEIEKLLDPPTPPKADP